jgi:hypothetical protein
VVFSFSCPGHALNVGFTICSSILLRFLLSRLLERLSICLLALWYGSVTRERSHFIFLFSLQVLSLMPPTCDVEAWSILCPYSTSLPQLDSSHCNLNQCRSHLLTWRFH